MFLRIARARSAEQSVTAKKVTGSQCEAIRTFIICGDCADCESTECGAICYRKQGQNEKIQQLLSGNGEAS